MATTAAESTFNKIVKLKVFNLWSMTIFVFATHDGSSKIQTHETECQSL